MFLIVAAIALFLPLALMVRNLFVFDLLQQLPDKTAETSQAIHDALLMHSTVGWIVAGVLVACLLATLVLKALGKNIPVVDTLLDLIVAVAKSFVKPKDPVDVPGTPEQKASQDAQPGAKAVGDVVDINSLSKEDKKNGGL